MTDRTDSKKIEAHPTKDLFISMLVKDIGLIRAIVDLVDNSVDGAKRAQDDEDYSSLWVRIEATRDHFRVADNCGGIPVDIARNYAFRFGRVANTPKTEHSVGQFGVGMKRALFKIGRWFKVESTTADSKFAVEVDVDEWSKDEDDWSFEFSEIEENLPEVNLERQGTTVTVERLHDGVAENFALDNFQSGLRRELEQAHLQSMDKGLSITLNEIPLRGNPLVFLNSGELKPAYMEKQYLDSDNPVKVKVFAGVSKSDPSTAGWYIFCNGRLVLGQDQTAVTGWGEQIPKYHNQFSRFRGYVFFDSDDAGNLPWNTTKTGVDSDSPIYHAVRLEMMRMARPVIDFLNRLDREKEDEEEEGRPLEAAVTTADSTNLSSVAAEESFVAPKPPKRPPRPSTTTAL